MCCSEPHYPKVAGIWRTDITGSHTHYGDTVTLHGHDAEQLASLHGTSIERADALIKSSCAGTHGDHWHAIMPVRITFCLENVGTHSFSFRVKDWYTHDHEGSKMAASHVQQRPMYTGWHSSRPKQFGTGYDYIGVVTVHEDGAAGWKLRDRLRERCLVAVSEGMDISTEAFFKLFSDERGVEFKPSPSQHRSVSRGSYPDYDTWLRGKPFTRPPMDGNWELYGSDAGKFITAGGDDPRGAGRWWEQLLEDVDPLEHALAGPAVEHALQTGLLKDQEAVYIAKAEAVKRAVEEYKKPLRIRKVDPAQEGLL